MHADLDRLKYYRSEIRFESELIGQRLGALLSSQSFLLIGYASSMAAANGRWNDVFALLLPPSLASLGLVLVLLALPGIRAGQDTLNGWRRIERELLANSPNLAAFTLPSDDDGSREMLHYRHDAFAQRAPLAFAVAWCLFGPLPIWLHFHEVG